MKTSIKASTEFEVKWMYEKNLDNNIVVVSCFLDYYKNLCDNAWFWIPWLLILLWQPLSTCMYLRICQQQCYQIHIAKVYSVANNSLLGESWPSNSSRKKENFLWEDRSRQLVILRLIWCKKHKSVFENFCLCY